MDKLIPLISKLQEIFYRTRVPFDVELPTIVVIGGQSSGKSSVLEAIVGRDFLPRGNNIVTRRPTQIQLINTPHIHKEYAEFAHKQGEKYYDFAKVREEIERDTARICGNNQDISNVPIFLKIFSPAVVDLTLVDLPGMTKVPTGDQPRDIEQKIEELSLQYVYPKTAIIMAVCPANNDLANSDALKLAKRADPQGERTIGVLTKIDLMDEGTSCMDIIRGQVYPLRLGFVPVVCRSQKDIQEGKSIGEALKAEKVFFQTNEAYMGVQSKAGIPYLSKTLNEVIVRHIKKCLPLIRSKLTSLLYQKEKELKTLHLNKDVGQQQQLILNVIAKFTKQYEEFIDGKFVKDTASELKGGSRLNYIFYDVYTKAINDVDPFDVLTDDDIKTAIRNAGALKPNLGVPEAAFEILSKQQIRRLEAPALQCVQLVFEELRRIIVEIEMPELQRFQGLRKKMNEEMLTLLMECLKPTNQMVKNLITVQACYINTYHPDFMGAGGSIMSLFAPEEFDKRMEEKQRRQEAARMKYENIEEGDGGAEVKDSWQKQGNMQYPGHVQQQQDLQAQEPKDRIKDANDYEINKYMQKNVKAVHMPRMPATKRAEDDDPGQSESRAAFEVKVLKNLILSYFDIVRKSINDMVPKTVVALLVNKSKLSAQHVLVQRIYQDGLNLEDLMSEDTDTKQSRQKCEDMVKTMRSSLEFLNEVRDFYFEESADQI